MKKQKLEVLHGLFIAARTVLEQAETVGNEQLVVDGDDMDDLEIAYQKVVKHFGPSFKGFKK